MALIKRFIDRIRSGIRFHLAYWGRLAVWALRETWAHVGFNTPTAIVAAVTTLVAFLIQWWSEGPTTAGLWRLFDSLPATMFATVSALVIVGILVLFINLCRAPAIMQAGTERQRDELDRNLRKINDKQAEVDHLSGLLSEGIHTIWNARVNDDLQLASLEAHWKDWHARVLAYLKENFHQADADHFDRLGVIPVTSRGGTYNGQGSSQGRHRRLLMHYALQEQRLREIVRDHNITHVYLQYNPIISTTKR